MHDIDTSFSEEPSERPGSRPLEASYDVVLIGAGLAGLTLARHLLLETGRSVLLLERRPRVPAPRQKVGESSVQLAGFYFSKVLDLEEYLMHHQLMKYNLRFYWKSGGDPSRFETYSQSYIRPFSNVASYQLDRNTFEAALLEMSLESPRFRFQPSVKPLDVELAEDGGEHRLRFEVEGEPHEVRARWVVDTSGRGKHLARRRRLEKENPIRHGAFFWWVEGTVDLDKLTDRPPREIRRHPNRAKTGHLPKWLATNHFMEEGLWFWVIPLQGKTSLGLVYDRAVVDQKDVFSVEKATRWVCEHFPCFAHDLPGRKVLDFGGYKDFSYDCKQTISKDRWALAGEAGRFSDPLYSPGSDLISIYNTLIVDAIETEDPELLAGKCRQYEQLMRSVYAAYEPSYAISYDALGDPEVFSLKYVWELAIYFGFYVFPFLNDFFTDRRFILAFLRTFARLGPINKGVQTLLSGYFQWKKENVEPASEPVFFDFMQIGTLREAEKTFYEIGVSVDEAKRVLARQLANLEELARFLAARAGSVVAGDPGLITNRAFVEGIDLQALAFDPEEMRRRAAAAAGCREGWEWSFEPSCLEEFRGRRKSSGELLEVAG